MNFLLLIIIILSVFSKLLNYYLSFLIFGLCRVEIFLRTALFEGFYLYNTILKLKLKRVVLFLKFYYLLFPKLLLLKLKIFLQILIFLVLVGIILKKCFDLLFQKGDSCEISLK